MASLLVHVDLVTLGEVLDLTRRDSGDLWQLGRSDLRASGGGPIDLGRLDDDAMLFICTLDGTTPMLVAWGDENDFDFDADGFVGAQLRLRDHDLTDVLPRLGCPSAAELAAFGRPPRVLPPNDVELLRYVLALADDRRRAPPAPEPLAADDAELAKLRDAVFADPGSDEPREIYADALLSRGDPRGELINLQLARARERRHLPSLRERALVDRLGDTLLGPLRPYITGSIIERGFVRAATTTYSTLGIPEASAHDSHWHTLEQLFTDDRNLLRSPAVRATRLGTRTALDSILARSKTPLPYTMIGGWVDLERGEPMQRQTGAIVQNWGRFVSSAAFANLTTLSLYYASTATRGTLTRFLGTPLAYQLEHLDLYMRTSSPPPIEVADAMMPPQISIRIDIQLGHTITNRVLLGLLEGYRTFEISHQLAPLEAQALRAFVMPILGHTNQEVAVIDYSGTENPHVREVFAPLSIVQASSTLPSLTP